MFQRYEGNAWEHRFLPRLTSKQIKDMNKDQALVILPLGAVEQHGPHLPIMTDALIGEATLTRTLEKIDDDHEIWLLPALAYGKSNEHIGIAGTMSLSADTLMSVVLDIAKSLQASGFHRLLLFNTHGGNTDILNVVAREIRIATGITVFYLSPSSLDVASDLIPADELEYGIHGGDYETSLVLSIKPNWVQMQWAPQDMPKVDQFKYLTMEGKIRFAWVMNDLSTSGIVGDATKANAEKGNIILERTSDILAEALIELTKFEMKALKE